MVIYKSFSNLTTNNLYFFLLIVVNISAMVYHKLNMDQ